MDIPKEKVYPSEDVTGIQTSVMKEFTGNDTMHAPYQGLTESQQKQLTTLNTRHEKGKIKDKNYLHQVKQVLD